MVLGKRGVFFTLLSILFVGVLFLIFNPTREAVLADTGEVLVDNTNAFRIQLEQNYVPTIVRQRSHAALVALSTDAQSRGVYLSLPADFSQAMTTGAYSAGSLPASFQTLPQAFANLSAAAAGIGYNLSISASNITVYQSGAFQAVAIINVSYNLSSRDGSVTFRTNSTDREVLFTLVEVPDLLFNSNASDLGWSDRRSFGPFYTLRWNNSLFLSLTANRSYAPNNDSPSIFNRLQGSYAPHPFGVETLIPTAVTPAGNLTSIDWQYFTGQGYTCTYNHSGVYPSLRLSFDGLADYNITNATLYQGPAGSCPAPLTYP